jgi:hypothetical protein
MGHTLLPVIFENIFFPLSTKYFYILAWLVSLMFFYPKIFTNAKFQSFYFLALLYLVLNYIGVYDIDFAHIFKIYIEPLIFSLMILQYFIESRDFRGLSILFGFSFVFISITLLTSILGLQRFPMASREMAGGGVESEIANFYRSIGIAGYGFFYGIAFMLPIFIHNLKENLGSRKKLLLWALITLLSLWGLAEAQFAAAFLFAIIGSAIIWWAKIHSIRMYLRLSLVTLLLILIPDTVYSNLILGIARLLEEGILQQRLVDLSITIEEGVSTADTHIAARADRIPILINSFFESPIIGGGINLYHNYWFDTLSQFGIVGILPWIVFLRTNILSNSKLMTIKYKNIYILVMFLFIVMGFIKGMGQKVLMIFIFFIIPSYLILLSYKQNINEK